MPASAAGICGASRLARSVVPRNEYIPCVTENVFSSCATVAIAVTNMPCGPATTCFMPARSSSSRTAATSASAGAKRSANAAGVRYSPYCSPFGLESSSARVFSPAAFRAAMCAAICTVCEASASPTCTPLVAQLDTWPASAVVSPARAGAAQAIAAASSPVYISRVFMFPRKGRLRFTCYDDGEAAGGRQARTGSGPQLRRR